MGNYQVRVSGHHLGTIAHYLGNLAGSPELQLSFLRNHFEGEEISKVEKLLKDIEGGATMTVVSEPDDFCNICRGNENKGCSDEIYARFLKASDIKEAGDLGVQIGSKTNAEYLLKKQVTF